MQYIAKAEAYENRLLDDGADELSADVSSIIGLGSADGDNRLPLGRFAARFVDDVNDEMQRRDAQITDVDVSSQFRADTHHFEPPMNTWLEF